MRTGKLAISRGHQIGDPPHLSLVPAETAAPSEHAPPASPDYQLVHDRLTALERLTRLHEQGALSAAEFAAEKLLILGLPADEYVLREHFTPAEPRPPQRGPSLIGRMLSGKFLIFSLAAGIALSLVAQPDATLRFFDQTLRYFGA